MYEKGGHDGSLVINIDRKTYHQILKHCLSNREIEVGGVLVGLAKSGYSADYLHVVGTIEARGAVSKRDAVTFTHESWNYIYQIQQQKYQGQKIVGWYHSHPGYGVFLSEHDQFIHRNFFNMKYAIALVVDPILSKSGCFIWNGADIEGIPFSLIPPSAPDVIIKPSLHPSIMDARINIHIEPEEASLETCIAEVQNALSKMQLCSFESVVVSVLTLTNEELIRGRLAKDASVLHHRCHPIPDSSYNFVVEYYHKRFSLDTRI